MTTYRRTDRSSVSRLLIFAVGFGVLTIAMPGCVTHRPQSVTRGKGETLRLEAEYYRKDGKTGIRLVRSSGDKDIDVATLKFLVDTTDKYPDLKEGETLPVKMPELGGK